MLALLGYEPTRKTIGYSQETDKIKARHPIKLGGWPQWIGDSRWDKNEEYFLQINSNLKGKLHIGDCGHLYLFKSSLDWKMVQDWH